MGLHRLEWRKGSVGWNPRVVLVLWFASTTTPPHLPRRQTLVHHPTIASLGRALASCACPGRRLLLQHCCSFSAPNSAEVPRKMTSRVEMITIPSADDFHHHFRDGEVLKDTVQHACRMFRRAIAMPNLKPPVTTTDEALDYRQRILACVPDGVDFTPLMTLYMTDKSSPEEIRKAKTSGHVYAVKLYPAGATTNSDSGVTDLAKVAPAMEAMAEVGMPLLIHGEVTTPGVDIFDKEARFIEEVIKPLVEKMPKLKIVMEHITTSEAVAFVTAAPPNVAATITPQHLLYNRNAIFQGGIRPHMYCLPVLKRETHRLDLVKAATSGNPKFFLGTDTAPHAQEAKISACGCAGIFTGHAALELYCEVFEKEGALDRLAAFCGHYGADFYGLPRNDGVHTLAKEKWTVPASYTFGQTQVVPLRAGEEVAWQMTGEGRRPRVA